jgi:hypothetical protein
VGKTWVLTGSLENFRTTREHGFRLIGAKERRRRMAKQIELVGQLEAAPAAA